MTVGKIALGVLLGNLAFALLAWLGLMAFSDGQQSALNARIAHQRLEAITGQPADQPGGNSH